MTDQTALESALMFAREQYRDAHDLQARRMEVEREIREREERGYAALAPLNNSIARVMRELNRELAAWYDALRRDRNDPAWKPAKWDSPPRIEWGESCGGSSGFRAAYRWDMDKADVVIKAHVYCHRWRLTIHREISTDKWDEIIAFLLTLTEMGKSAIKAAHDTCAPSWMDKQ